MADPEGKNYMREHRGNAGQQAARGADRGRDYKRYTSYRDCTEAQPRREVCIGIKYKLIQAGAAIKE